MAASSYPFPAAALAPEAILGAARLWVRQRFPYFSTFLSEIRTYAMPGMNTFGVTADWVIYYDPAKLAEWGVAGSGIVLVHEIGHLMAEHFDRAQRLGVTTAQEHYLWNRAGDACINDPLIAAGHLLPEGAVTSQGLQLPPNGFIEAYYRELLSRPQPPQQGQGQGQGQGQQPTPMPRSKDLDNGSNSGGATSKRDIEAQIPKNLRRTRQHIKQNLRRAAEEARRQAAKGIGDMPEWVVREAERILGPAQVSWKQRLAAAIRVAMRTLSGQVEYVQDRPSRRGAWRKDVIVQSRLRAPWPEVAVVVDTSGSVDKRQLGYAINEIRGIVRRFSPHGIEVLGGDTEVCARAKHCTTRAQIEKALVGFGGTDLSPALRELDIRPATTRPHVVVYATDGIADEPYRPRHFKVVWLLLGETLPPPAPWGQAVNIKVSDLAQETAQSYAP